ncbi:MAG: HAMP domain-containing sensor histidine kinase [Christensenellaceae bacterium]
MLIKKGEILSLSENVRKAIDGEQVDFRDNRENALSLLKNDIHTLVNTKNEQASLAIEERKLLAEYLSNISHQLKTPITSMQIMADLIEIAPPDKQAEFIANIKMSLTQMEWLTTALLRLAKLDSGAVNFNKQTLSVTSLAKTALEPLGILLDIKNQDINISNNINVSCDIRWTAQALTNIIKNASEYSPDSSTIVIDCGENPIYNWISVTDRGSGIKREDLPKLWGRFTGSRSGDGYGIGLPLALSIIRSQNGDIDVDIGGNGKGATFIIKLFK